MSHRCLTVALTVALLAGCEKPVPPVYEDPIPLPLVAEAGSAAPRLTVGADGTVLLSWIEKVEQGGRLRVSPLGVQRWEEAQTVVEDPAMFVNWADYPSVTDFGGGYRLAHWLSYSANEAYAYDVMLSQSFDGGANWGESFSPHDDGTPTEHGFVSIWPQGAMAGLLWLDGRKMMNKAATDAAAKGMTLRSALIDRNGDVSGEQVVDDLVCECCDTDVAVAAGGPIAVYRNRTPEEIREIFVSRYVDGQWQPGEQLSDEHWQVSGCPVNGPAIAADGKLVAVAWFTAAADSPRVYVRLSTDGGRNFGEKILAKTRTTLGQVDIAWIGDRSFAVSWLESGSGLHDVRVRSVTTAGELGREKTVGRSAVSRMRPEMVFHDGHLVFAWTDQVNDATRLASVSVEVAYAR